MVHRRASSDEQIVTSAFDGLLEELAVKQKRLCMVEVMLRKIEAPLQGIQREITRSMHSIV
jgi:hypothetical protein